MKRRSRKGLLSRRRSYSTFTTSSIPAVPLLAPVMASADPITTTWPCSPNLIQNFGEGAEVGGGWSTGLVARRWRDSSVSPIRYRASDVKPLASGSW